MARIEELTREAVSLPKEQRLALARVLLDLEPVSSVAEVEQSWDEVIRARIKAVDEGRGTGIAYDDLRREMRCAMEDRRTKKEDPDEPLVFPLPSFILHRRLAAAAAVAPNTG